MNKEKILFRSSFKIINMISWIRFTISLFYLMKFFWGKNKLTHKIIKKKVEYHRNNCCWGDIVNY